MIDVIPNGGGAPIGAGAGAAPANGTGADGKGAAPFNPPVCQNMSQSI